MKIVPRAKQVLVRPDPDPAHLSEYGIVTPANVEQERKASGEVLAVGGEVKDIKKGDHVLYGVYAGDPVKLGKEEYKIIHADDILGFII